MGDGGALTLRSREWYERARRLRWLGIDRTTWDRTGLDQSYWWRYRVDEPGMKCHMNDIAAAIGLVQLDRLPWANGRRRALVERYFEGLCGLEEVELPASDDDTYESAWHIFHIKCRDRNGLSAFLQQCGVATGVHYMPIHTYACYGSPPILPHAESVQDRILTLPLYPGLTDDEVVYIVERIAAFYRRCRR
jgi:perosamine synthetase